MRLNKSLLVLPSACFLLRTKTDAIDLQRLATLQFDTWMLVIRTVAVWRSRRHRPCAVRHCWYWSSVPRVLVKSIDNPAMPPWRASLRRVRAAHDAQQTNERHRHPVVSVVEFVTQFVRRLFHHEEFEQLLHRLYFSRQRGRALRRGEIGIEKCGGLGLFPNACEMHELLARLGLFGARHAY